MHNADIIAAAPDALAAALGVPRRNPAILILKSG
jgi:hypothetical protein